MDGQEIMTSKLTSMENIDKLENVNKGIYFLHILTGNESSIEKLVIE